jgi:hypothetical protein
MSRYIGEDEVSADIHCIGRYFVFVYRQLCVSADMKFRPIHLSADTSSLPIRFFIATDAKNRTIRYRGRYFVSADSDKVSADTDIYFIILFIYFKVNEIQ